MAMEFLSNETMIEQVNTRKRRKRELKSLNPASPFCAFLMVMGSITSTSSLQLPHSSLQHRVSSSSSRLYVQASESRIRHDYASEMFVEKGRDLRRQFAPRYQTYEAEKHFGREVLDQINPTTVEKQKPSYLPSREDRVRVTENIRRLLEDEADHNSYGANEIATHEAVFTQLSEVDKRHARDAVAKKRESVQDLEPIYNGLAPKRKKKRKITASVVETGRDTITTYIKSLGNHQVLSAADEQVLGRQIQLLANWEKKRQELETSLARPPTFGEWASAIDCTVTELRKQVRKSHKAKAALMEANLRLVVSVARQTVKKNRSEINFQDACQEGILGLSRACEKFDPSRGFRFSTYAVWWIKCMVRRNLEEQSRPVRLPKSAMRKINEIRIQERVMKDELGRFPSAEEIGKKIGMSGDKVEFYRRSVESVQSLDKKIKFNKGTSDGREPDLASVIGDPSQSPTLAVEKVMMKEDVRRLVKTLSPREQAVIRLRFGFDDGRPRTRQEVGAKFKVDSEQIRKIEERALGKLRQPYRKQSLQPYVDLI